VSTYLILDAAKPNRCSEFSSLNFVQLESYLVGSI